MTDLVLVTAAGIGLLWGIGFLLRSLVPWRYRAAMPLLAPFLGLAVVSGLCHWLGWAGIALRPVSWLFVLLAALGWSNLLLPSLDLRLPRRVLAPLQIAGGAFLLAAAPLIRLGYLTTIGVEIDAVSHAVRSEYLMDSPLRQPPLEPGRPELIWANAHIMLIRAGDVYLVALLGILTGKRSYELLTVVAAGAFALSCSSTYLWLRWGLRTRHAVAIAAAVLVGIHNFLLWVVYDNFLSQALGISLVPLVWTFGREALLRPGWRSSVLFGLFAACLAGAYPSFFAVALLTLAAAWLVEWVAMSGRRRWPLLRRGIAAWCLAAVVALLGNGVAVARAVVELRFNAAAVAPSGGHTGNIGVFPPPTEIAGLIAHAGAHAAPVWHPPRPLHLALAGVAMALIVLGCAALPPRSRLAGATILLACCALLFHQRFIAFAPRGFPYGYSKLAALTAVVVAGLVASGLVAVWNRRRLRAIAALCAAVLVVVNLVHTTATQIFALRSTLVVDRDLIEAAAAVRLLPPEEWLLIDVPPGQVQNWLGYFLLDRRIRHRGRLWIPRPEEPPPARQPVFRYTLIRRASGAQGVAASSDSREDTLVWSNAAYSLWRMSDRTLARLDLASRRWQNEMPIEVTIGEEEAAVLAFEGQLQQMATAPGSPRTFQLDIAAFGEAKIDGPGGSVALTPGVWTVDADLACVPSLPLRLRRGGEAILLAAEARLLGVATGAAGRCLEALPASGSRALVRQRMVGVDRIRYEIWLISSSAVGTLRFALHVGDADTGKSFGAWGFDFAPGPPFQRGVLEVDLSSGSATGSAEGRPVPVAGPGSGLAGPGSGAAGRRMVGTLVWSQTETGKQINLENVIWLRRSAGRIEVDTLVAESTFVFR